IVEAFPIRTIVSTSTSYVVYLQIASGAIARLGYSVTRADRAKILNATFPAERAVRIVNRSDRHHYGVIASTQIAPEPAVILTGPSPQIRFRNNSALSCSITSNETSATINTVNFIQYRLSNLR